MRVLPLRGTVQHYAWGSRTALAAWRGRPPSGEPEAELWFGDHPRGTAVVDLDGREISLAALVAKAPDEVLGRRVVRRFGPRLPFLLKVLAVEEPLSIQAHPDSRQARAGFEREEAAGIARNAPERCYPDPNPKPELVVALRSFEVLCGFRAPEAIARTLALLELPDLAAASGAGGLEGLFREWFGEATPHRIERAVAAARRAPPGDPALAWIDRLAALHPADPGVLAPAFLHRVTLRPGQGLFLGPGVPHAYLSGLAVEVMASSDNVLRAGLSRKHVDLAELGRVLRFEAGTPAVVEAVPRAPGEAVFATPAGSFELSVLEADTSPRIAAGSGVSILLCTEGRVRVLGDAAGAVELETGSSCLVPDSTGCRLEGLGRVHRAAVPA